ncbi:methylmalonyl Co-A mutase-associated GTPase MeaB [Rhodoblastus sphagnicola]|uniref:Methylmalonyl Co-A mutase-associated GTPase MeaB n=1 Tax=Rhodoblastus sphagnicola TaxID=333368 RepID=A0A2S6N6H0_9HYPH|nr:methylmalonyl Co-A mutase-associated GTPase MeaB [Rhodoblastus sphagnicola]MBB4197688.1 LAO/AO transport system kinase [Rhodoblastus sphagnicola]PPQ30211.1 methylmalonyl Co-A mutase-associated GTPase MeaB [Rhodoblastus sphagnicola]
MIAHPRSIDIAVLAEKLRGGDRAALARAITLVESVKPDHQTQARELVQELLPYTGGAMRVGITGVPGVGKSTTIDTLGHNLVQSGQKVAVLAVDPSSTRTGGSILGDKTRMAKLSPERNAFIRPSPSSGTLGGVAAKTRETMLLCEAAGFDVVIVETVGIGQSETTVADMTDFFLVLMLPGAGDELQGIKKGVLEIADMIAVNKSEGEGRKRAVAAAGEYRAALHIMQAASPNWSPPVVLISGLDNIGLDEMWAQVVEHRRLFEASGEFAQKRRAQQVKWMWTMLEERLHSRLRKDPKVKARLPELERRVAEGALSPTLAVEDIAALLGL